MLLKKVTDVGEYAAMLHRYVDEGSIESIREVRQAAIALGHPELLYLAAIAEDGVGKGYDYRDLTLEEYDEKTRNGLVPYGEKLATLKNAIGLRGRLGEYRNGDRYGIGMLDLVIKYDTIRLVDVLRGKSWDDFMSDVYASMLRSYIETGSIEGIRQIKQVADNLGNGVLLSYATIAEDSIMNGHEPLIVIPKGTDAVGELYSELFLNRIEGPFYRIFPEFAGDVAGSVESAVLQSASFEEARERISGTYSGIFNNLMRQNLSRLGTAVEAGDALPEDIDIAYAQKVLGLADELGFGEQVAPLYAEVGIRFTGQNPAALL